MDAPTAERRRTLVAVLARHAARVRSRGALWSGVLRALGTTVLAALLAVPFAAAWGIAHAEVEDYLGPHRVWFTTNFSGEVAVDLGPTGPRSCPAPPPRWVSPPRSAASVLPRPP